MGTSGWVSFLVEDKGVIIVNNEDGDIEEDKLMETALEAGAEDFAAGEGVFEIYTVVDDLYAVKEALESAGYPILSAEPDKIPTTTVALTDPDDQKFMGLLIDMLEEDDDVMDVYHNWDN